MFLLFYVFLYNDSLWVAVLQLFYICFTTVLRCFTKCFLLFYVFLYNDLLWIAVWPLTRAVALAGTLAATLAGTLAAALAGRSVRKTLKKLCF